MPDIIIPQRKKPTSDAGYFEIVTQAVFQAGFSWKVVEAKWGGFGEIFGNFNPKIIAQWNEDQILAALESPFIIRNERKIRATVENAKQFLILIEKHGSFEKYIKSISSKSYKEISNILKDQFKWMGKTGAFFFLYRINEDVPKWENR